MKRLFNPCRRYRKNLCLLASGVLPEPEMAGIEIHLAGCAGCQRYYEEMKTIAVPLVAWERRFECVEPSARAGLRWAKAIATAGSPESMRTLAAKITLFECWRQLIQPARRIWAGLAVTWLLILIANLNFQTGRPQMTATASPHPADFIQALQEQQQMMGEWSGQPELKAAEPPKPVKPSAAQPRSEWRGTTFAI